MFDNKIHRHSVLDGGNQQGCVWLYYRSIDMLAFLLLMKFLTGKVSGPQNAGPLERSVRAQRHSFMYVYFECSVL